jgi:hypothetical protein
MLCQLWSCGLQQNQVHQEGKKWYYSILLCNSSYLYSWQDLANRPRPFLRPPDTAESGPLYPSFLASQYIFSLGRTVDQKNSCKSVSRSKSAEEAAAKLLKSPKHRCAVLNLVQNSKHLKLDTIRVGSMPKVSNYRLN